jgi:hypothetical protein
MKPSVREFPQENQTRGQSAHNNLLTPVFTSI